MVKVDYAERELINELTAFKKESLATIENVCAGLRLLAKPFSLDASEVSNTEVYTILKKLEDVINEFCIGSDKDSSNDGTENLWLKLNSSRCYRDANSSPVTEKRVAFVLMSFEREVSTLLSALEDMQKNDPLYFAITLRNKLSKIIEDYLTALI